MARVLFGEINIQADERGRIRIPSSYREYFGDSALYCTVAPGAKCLSIFGQDVLDKLVDQMGGNSIIGDEEENGCNVRDFSAAYTSSTRINKSVLLFRKVTTI